MQPVNLFDLATQQAKWLSVRQTAVAGNIANINTPGYKTVEVEPFESILDNSTVAIRKTDPDHITTGSTRAFQTLTRQDTGPALMPSENTVVLETELMKAGEVRRTFELNTAIVKAFHRMFMMTARS